MVVLYLIELQFLTSLSNIYVPHSVSGSFMAVLTPMDSIQLLAGAAMECIYFGLKMLGESEYSMLLDLSVWNRLYSTWVGDPQQGIKCYGLNMSSYLRCLSAHMTS